MARRPEDTPWTRQLLVGIGALVAAALVIGGVMSVVALGAARVSGIGKAATPTREPERLVIPSGEPTTEPEPYPDPSVAGASGTPSASATPSPSPSASPTRRPRPITLQAFPTRVAANERINLTGVYQRGEGARLQVQRFEGGAWQDFPVATTVSGGVFSTYVYTGRQGTQRFRVVDTATGRASNAVRVVVG